VTTQFQDRFTFEIDPFRKMCLMEGLDEISLTEKSAAAIADYERKLDADRPWMRPAA
jgi:3-isopropylmalate dehydratase small subunit